MLESAGHAIQHTAVHFNRSANQIQTNLFTSFFRRLTNHAVEPIRQTFEFHHAGAQQVVLQVTRQTSLSGQFVFGTFYRALQSTLHSGHVVDRLGHHASELLETSESVKFERVERLISCFSGFQT